jgi:hypothetical protein
MRVVGAGGRVLGCACGPHHPPAPTIDSPAQGRGSGFALSTLFRRIHAYSTEQIAEAQPIGGSGEEVTRAAPTTQGMQTMMHSRFTFPPIDAGSPDYWRDLKRGHMLIAAAHAANASMKAAPEFIIIGHPSKPGFARIRANHGPFEVFAAACRAVEDDPAARSILRANPSLHVGDYFALPY